MERRILIHTPRGRDAQVVEQVLATENLRSLVCETPQALFEQLTEGAAAVIVTEEALGLLLKSELTDWLKTQPPWSDLPFIVLATKQAKRRSAAAHKALQQLGNMIILERPVNAETLASAAHAAIRARTRQYLARQQLDEIHQAHEQLRLAQMAGGIGVFRINIATDMLVVSPEFCRLFGLPVVDTLPAKDIERMVVSNSNSHPISTAESRRNGSAALDVEYCVRRADTGETRWISRRAEFVYEHGKPTWMRGVVQDITERKLAEVTLRESEARFRALSETMPNHVWTTDESGWVTWVNRQLCEYTG